MRMTAPMQCPVGTEIAELMPQKYSFRKLLALLVASVHSETKDRVVRTFRISEFRQDDAEDYFGLMAPTHAKNDSRSFLANAECSPAYVGHA
jgi:hypothetical protein